MMPPPRERTAAAAAAPTAALVVIVNFMLPAAFSVAAHGQDAAQQERPRGGISRSSSLGLTAAGGLSGDGDGGGQLLPLLDVISFGNSTSEALHLLKANGVDASIQSGLPCRSPCRRHQPAAATLPCHSGWSPGAPTLTFTMRVDGQAQNYLTVKFDGSETAESTAITVLNESFGGRVSDCSFPPELNLCFGTGDGVSENHCADPVFAGRWQYSTMLLPRPLTDGKDTATVTLATVEGHTMQSVFRAYTHTSAMPPIAAAERQPPPPPPAGPMLAPHPSASQFEFLLSQVDSGVGQMMNMQLFGPTWDKAVTKMPSLAALTGGLWPHTKVNGTNFAGLSKDHIKNECLGHSIGSNNNWFRGLEVMARSFYHKSSRYFRSPEVLKRVIAGVDFYQLAQGLNGGFDPRPRLPEGWIGAPNRRNGSGCLEGYGHMGFSAAVQLIAADLTDEILSEKIDADDTGTKTMTRRDAWTRLLVNSRDYLLWNRGHAPNQDLADVLAAHLADSALASITPASRLPRAFMLRAARQAVGILRQPSDGGQHWKPSTGTGPVNESQIAGYWFSKQGISMEPNTNVNGGYSHGYGDEEWALGWLASLSADEDVLSVARRHVRNFGRFRVADNCQFNSTDGGGDFVSARCMRLESVITWRHNKNPGTISYGAGDPQSYMALNASEPTSIRLAQMRISHARAFALDASSDAATRSPHWPDLLAASSIWLGSFQALASLPPTDFRLPMEAESPDFAWADVQAGAVAIKHKGVRLFASLQWRHGYVNRNKPRLPANVRLNDVARVHMTVVHNSTSMDHVMNVKMQEMQGVNAGWARLYATEPIGRFTIAMNGQSNATLFWPLPASMVETSAIDLVSGEKHCHLGRTLAIPPLATVVLWREECA